VDFATPSGPNPGHHRVDNRDDVMCPRNVLRLLNDFLNDIHSQNVKHLSAVNPDDCIAIMYAQIMSGGRRHSAISYLL
jgi:hypothetical protein